MPSGHNNLLLLDRYPQAKMRIYIHFVAWQLPKANCANTVVTCHESRARLGIYPVTIKIQNLRRFRYGCSTKHFKLQLLKESATNINSKQW